MRSKKKTAKQLTLGIIIGLILLGGVVTGTVFGVSALLPPASIPAGGGDVSHAGPEDGGESIDGATFTGRAEDGNAPQAQDPDAGLTEEPYDPAGLSGYQLKYPDMRVKKPNRYPQNPVQKTAYLTFDDGPSKFTPRILDILDQYGIKATFFVTGEGKERYRDYYREIVERGHTIAIHTYSHDYKKIYASVDAFLDDYYQMFTEIRELTGVSPELFRFPGGSVNGYNKKVNTAIIEEMTRRGFTYYDWNVSSADSARGTTVETVKGNILNATPDLHKAIILMHDAGDKQPTVDALEEVILGLRQQGFVFDRLTKNVKPYSYR